MKMNELCYDGEIDLSGLSLPYDHYVDVSELVTLDVTIKTSAPIILVMSWSHDGISVGVDLSHVIRRSSDVIKTAILMKFLKLSIASKDGVFVDSFSVKVDGVPQVPPARNKRLSFTGILKHFHPSVEESESEDLKRSIPAPLVPEVAPSGLRKWTDRVMKPKPIYDDRMPHLLLKGMLFYADRPNHFKGLPIGMEGSVLKVVNGLPEWVNYEKID